MTFSEALRQVLSRPNDANVVSPLVSKGAAVSYTAEGGETPLHWATG